jgi:hypothetical protein
VLPSQKDAVSPESATLVSGVTGRPSIWNCILTPSIAARSADAGAAPVPSFDSGVPFAVLGLTISSVVGFPPPCERYHRRDMAEAMNRVARVELVLNQTGDWDVAVTNEIASEHGRGSQIHGENAGNKLRPALDVARKLALDLEIDDIVAQMRADSAKAVMPKERLFQCSCLKCFDLRRRPATHY